MKSGPCIFTREKLFLDFLVLFFFHWVCLFPLLTFLLISFVLSFGTFLTIYVTLKLYKIFLIFPFLLYSYIIMYNSVSLFLFFFFIYKINII